VGNVDYVGTKSTHLNVLSDLNQPVLTNGEPIPFDPVTLKQVNPFPNFGYIEYQGANGFGVYHGLETGLERRFSKGFAIHAAYTFSRSIDNTPQELENNNSGAAQKGFDYASWKSVSDFDTPHRFVASYSYDLPFGKGQAMLQSGILSYIIGGFRTSGVYTYASGRPFTVTSGTGSVIDANGAATAMPFLAGPEHVFGNVNGWFDTSAYRIRKAANLEYYGDFGRNTLRGPSTNVFDFALLKDFSIQERTNLQFRWEVFNLFNFALFGQPTSNLSSGSVGQISSLAGDPRLMQFALRLSF